MVMMLPGLDISISQGRLIAESGQPVQISGRVTALGLGVPALVLVRLERGGETVASATSLSGPDGSYSVEITPEDSGDFMARALAFPPVPGVNTFLPPVSESRPRIEDVERIPQEVQERAAQVQVPVSVSVPPAPAAAPPQITVIGPTGAPAGQQVQPPPTPQEQLLPVFSFQEEGGQVSGRVVGFIVE